MAQDPQADSDAGPYPTCTFNQAIGRGSGELAFGCKQWKEQKDSFEPYVVCVVPKPADGKKAKVKPANCNYAHLDELTLRLNGEFCGAFKGLCPQLENQKVKVCAGSAWKLLDLQDELMHKCKEIGPIYSSTEHQKLHVIKVSDWNKQSSYKHKAEMAKARAKLIKDKKESSLTSATRDTSQPEWFKSVQFFKDPNCSSHSLKNACQQHVASRTVLEVFAPIITVNGKQWRPANAGVDRTGAVTDLVVGIIKGNTGGKGVTNSFVSDYLKAIGIKFELVASWSAGHAFDENALATGLNKADTDNAVGLIFQYQGSKKEKHSIGIANKRTVDQWRAKRDEQKQGDDNKENSNNERKQNENPEAANVNTWYCIQSWALHDLVRGNSKDMAEYMMKAFVYPRDGIKLYKLIPEQDNVAHRTEHVLNSAPFWYCYRYCVEVIWFKKKQQIVDARPNTKDECFNSCLQQKQQPIWTNAAKKAQDAIAAAKKAEEEEKSRRRKEKAQRNGSSSSSRSSSSRFDLLGRLSRKSTSKKNDETEIKDNARSVNYGENVAPLVAKSEGTDWHQEWQRMGVEAVPAVQCNAEMQAMDMKLDLVVMMIACVGLAVLCVFTVVCCHCSCYGSMSLYKIRRALWRSVRRWSVDEDRRKRQRGRERKIEMDMNSEEMSV